MIIYVLRKDNLILLLLYEGNRCVELSCFENDPSLSIGTIMTARVKDVVANIAAAFVDIGEDRNAYLPFSEINNNTVFSKKISPKPIVAGDEILIQIVKEPMGSKPYNVTGKLSLSGKGTVVACDGKKSVNVSKKLKSADALAKKLSDIIAEKTEDYSVIIRTNAINISEEDLLDEMDRLWQQMSEIRKNASFRTAGSVMHSPIAPWMEVLRDTRNDILDGIVTDDKELYDELVENCRELGIDRACLRFYQESYPLKEKISLYSVVRDVSNRTAWMKSGAYLVIEQTEALVSIDVNSGKAEKKADMETFYLQINREAAVEAARQIRLRNLSGIILIDFINMRKDEHREEIIRLMNAELSGDSVKSHVAGFTKLGLMEITREKKNKPVAQMNLSIF